jgi:hypothetical protein
MSSIVAVREADEVGAGAEQRIDERAGFADQRPAVSPTPADR